MNYGKPEDFVELKAQRQRQLRHGDAGAAPWAIEDFGDYESGRGADKVGSVKLFSQLQDRWGLLLVTGNSHGFL